MSERHDVVRVIVAACGPSLVTLALVGAIWHAGPRQFVPLWNDETIYWNEAAIFLRAGFSGGYVAVDEKPAAVSFSRFGPHGPAFAVLYGTIGRFAGWRPYSAYLIHLLLIPVCAAAWFWVTRHNSSRWGPALLVVGFWPLLFYLPTHMQEPRHFGLALLLAALVESRLATPWRIVLYILFFSVASMTRATWALAVPAAMWSRVPGWRRRILSIPVVIAAFLFAFFAVTRAAGPYPHSAWIAAAVSDPVRGASGRCSITLSPPWVPSSAPMRSGG